MSGSCTRLTATAAQMAAYTFILLRTCHVSFFLVTRNAAWNTRHSYPPVPPPFYSAKTPCYSNAYHDNGRSEDAPTEQDRPAILTKQVLRLPPAPRSNMSNDNKNDDDDMSSEVPRQTSEERREPKSPNKVSSPASSRSSFSWEMEGGSSLPNMIGEDSKDPEMIDESVSQPPPNAGDASCSNPSRERGMGISRHQSLPSPLIAGSLPPLSPLPEVTPLTTLDELLRYEKPGWGQEFARTGESKHDTTAVLCSSRVAGLVPIT